MRTNSVVLIYVLILKSSPHMFPNNLQQLSLGVFLTPAVPLPGCGDSKSCGLRTVLCANKSASWRKKLLGFMRFLLVLVSVSVFVSCGCRIHHEHNFDEDGQDGSLAFSHFCLPLATSCNTPTQAPSLRRSTRCQPLQLLRHNVAHINVPKKLTAI